MEKIIQILNEMEKSGIVQRYALGGAVALLFYTEPVLTYDLDVFIAVPPPTAGLITLTPIYEHLKALGCEEQQEHLIVAGTPVQFIPAYNALIEEALREAVEKSFHLTKVRVLGLEYLLAIMLQTGRPKDQARLGQLLYEVQPDATLFAGILERHGLTQRWKAFLSRLE